MNWVTEITHVKEKSMFIDEQRFGPYKMWHHEHQFIKKNDGVIMKDIISYIPPFGVIGHISNKLFIVPPPVLGTWINIILYLSLQL